MNKTDSEIKNLFKNLMKNKKGSEASKLRTAYILYHTTENENTHSHRDLLREFLVYDKLHVDVVHGVNAEDSERKINVEQQDLCGINAFLTAKTFLTAKSFLSYFGENSIHLAEDLLKKEWTALEAPLVQQLNAIWLFNSYIGNKDKILSTKEIDLLEGKHSVISIVQDSFTNGFFEDFKIRILKVYDKNREAMLEDDNEDIRIANKGCMVLYYAHYKLNNQLEEAGVYLEKALVITKPEELEYNVLRFLRKELQTEMGEKSSMRPCH